jgi:hypothetical protein
VSSIDSVLRAHGVKTVEPAIKVGGQDVTSGEFLRLIQIVVENDADLAALVADLEANPDVDSVSLRYPVRTMASSF